jgi:hypothetical protein
MYSVRLLRVDFVSFSLVRIAIGVVAALSLGCSGQRVALPNSQSDRRSLREAIDAATAVAFGQVERIERKEGRPVFTLRVADVAKGNLPDLVVFYVDRARDARLGIGDYTLAFLTPSGQTVPAWQVALNGEAFSVGFHVQTEPYVEETLFGGLALPESLCNKEVRRDFSVCSAPLSKVLAHLGLSPPELVTSSETTFRLASMQCGPGCRLEDWTNQLPPGLTDCGRGELGRRLGEGIMHCVLDAQKAKGPFKVRVPIQCIDSQCEQVFVFTGSDSFFYSYDSSAEGGGPCSSVVSRTQCASFEVAVEPGASSWLRCKDPRPTEFLCDQITSRVENLGEPESAQQLNCSAKHDGYYFGAYARDDGRWHFGAQHPTGMSPYLVCHPSPVAGLSCFAE